MFLAGDVVFRLIVLFVAALFLLMLLRKWDSELAHMYQLGYDKSREGKKAYWAGWAVHLLGWILFIALAFLLLR